MEVAPGHPLRRLAENPTEWLSSPPVCSEISRPKWEQFFELKKKPFFSINKKTKTKNKPHILDLLEQEGVG